MTLIIAANGACSAWLAADRRLTNGNRVLSDRARKLIRIDTPDAKAIIGYSGLGATALGTEPADWMAAVLRNRRRSLRDALVELAEAAHRQLPPHLLQLPSAPDQRKQGGIAHQMVAIAIENGAPRTFTINVVFEPDQIRTELTTPIRPSQRQRLAVSGSGSPALASQEWRRSLLNLIRAHDRGRASAEAVAHRLAALNLEASKQTADGSVGPNCIVAYALADGGGAHFEFDGTSRSTETAPIPTLANEFDVGLILDVMMPDVWKTLEALKGGVSAEDVFSKERLDAALATRHLPDEKLK